MGGEWQLTTVGKFIESNGGEIKTGPFGTRLKASEYSNEGVPVISVGEVQLGKLVTHERTPKVDSTVTDRMPEYLLREGDIVFGRKGAVERSARVASDQHGWFLGSDGIRLRLPSTCDSRFVSYHFLSEAHKQWMIQHAAGTTMASLNEKIVRRIPLTLPSLPEQKAIAHILGTLDDKIELNRQMNATLEAMAQALFKSWFVDFDPVIDKALASGNPIPEPLRKRAETRRALGDKRKPLPADIAQHFPDRFVFNEEMGWVPEGWEVMPLSQAININPRVPLKKGVIAKYVDMKALPTSGYSIDVVIEKEYSGGAKYENGDVLLARITPCLENGKTGIVDFLKENEIGFGSTEFVVLRGKDTIKTPFIAALSRDEVFRQHCTTSMVGSSGRQRVQKSAFDSYFLCTPDNDVILNEYHRLCSVKFDMITVRKNEINSLATLRDTLLPKLLSGQLRIPDAEKMIKETNP